MIMQICMISHRQISEKESANDVGDDMSLNMIEDSFFYGADTEQVRGKDNLEFILVNDRICGKIPDVRK